MGVRCLIFLLFVTLCTPGQVFSQKKGKNKKCKNAKAQTISEMDRVSGERAFFDGIKYRAVDNYEEAIDAFTASLTFLPNNDAAHYELAVIYFKELDFNLADFHLNKALSIDPDNTWYMAFLAEIYVGNNKLAEATELYRGLHTIEPAKRSHLNNIAVIQSMLRDTLSALETYQQYISTYGLDVEVYSPYVTLLKQHKNWLEIEALSSAAFDIDFLQQEAFQDHLMALLRQDKAKAVEDWLDEGKKIPQLAPAVVDFATRRALKRGDLDAWIIGLNDLFAFGSLGIDYQKEQINQWVKSYSNLRDDRVVAFVDSLFLQTRDSEDLKHLVTIYMVYKQHERHAKMVDALQRAINLDKGDFRLWSELFYTPYDLGDFESLLQVTQEAKNYFFAQPLIFFMEGVANSELGMRLEAISAWTMAMTTSSEHKPTIFIQALTALLDLYEEAAQNDKAILLLDTNMEPNQVNSSEIAEAVGEGYKRFGEDDRARIWFQRAMDLGGDAIKLQTRIKELKG